jgi:hypothetical protein
MNGIEQRAAGALPCPRISSTNETNRYNITQIFLKMALK